MSRPNGNARELAHACFKLLNSIFGNQGKIAVHVHLGGPECFESHSFYPKHGYQPTGDRRMMKKLWKREWQQWQMKLIVWDIGVIRFRVLAEITREVPDHRLAKPGAVDNILGIVQRFARAGSTRV